MNDIWNILGISRTDDRRAIRKAFAEQSRLHHPEEEPEYFIELNNAYKNALAYAENAENTANVEDVKNIDKTGSVVGTGNIADTAKAAYAENDSHTINGSYSSMENPAETAAPSLLDKLYSAETQNIQQSMQKGALRDFITLFENPKQVKQIDTWKRFFLSEAFLGEQFQEEFGKGLFTYLSNQSVFPSDNLPMGLLQELAIAYAFIPHFAGVEYFEGKIYPKEWYKVSVEDTFLARKYAAEIFNMQGRDCDLKSMTRHILKMPANKVRHNSFSDYLALKEMNQNGQLTEHESKTWQKLLKFAKPHHLYERNGKSAADADGEARSECLIKLYVQWMKDEQIPECVLKFIYRELEFKDLEHSSTRGLYGALKEQVLRQFPNVEELLFAVEGNEQMAVKIYKACSKILNENQTNYEKSIYGETPEIEEKVKAFFAMPEWEKLKGDRTLFDKIYSVANRLVVPRSMAEGLIKYLEAGDFQEPKRSEFMEALLRSLSTERMCRELDYRCEVIPERTDVIDIGGDNIEFWQYYFMRGFGYRHINVRGAWENEMIYVMDGRCYLPAYINYIYAPSSTWQKLFTHFDSERNGSNGSDENKSSESLVSAVCDMPGERQLRVEFHYHYCLYFVDEEQVITPVLSFLELKEYAEKIEKAEEFFFLLGVTAIEEQNKGDAERLIEAWLAKTPIYPFLAHTVAKLLAADNDRIPEYVSKKYIDKNKNMEEADPAIKTQAVYYSEQERFCFRALVSETSVRIFRQTDFGWEDKLFRKKEFGWKECSLPQSLKKKLMELPQADLGERKRAALEILDALRTPMPVRRKSYSLDGMDVLQKASVILEAMGYPENPEGYCILRYGDKKERRHDKVFYGAAVPFGFEIKAHSAEYESRFAYRMADSEKKIKEPKKLLCRFGWGFKYSTKSDYGPICIYQGESGTYYSYCYIKICSADTMAELLAKQLPDEFEGVTEVETYEGCLTVSRLDHRLEYCYGEEEFFKSVHAVQDTEADFFTVFGRQPLWMEFEKWLDAALEKGLPPWVKMLVIDIDKRNGRTLSFMGMGEAYEDFEEDCETANEETTEQEIYVPELPLFAWKNGADLRDRMSSLREAVEWYKECGNYAETLKNNHIDVVCGA